MRTLPSPQSRQGFTLLELLIAVVIIGILAALVFPQTTLLANNARQVAVASSLRDLVHAQEILASRESRYAEDIDDEALVFQANANVNVTIEFLLPDNTWLATAEYISWPDTRCAVLVGRTPVEGYRSSQVYCGND